MSDNKVYVGTVVWFSNVKNFGFLLWSNQEGTQPDMFVHYSDINSEGFRTLHKDQKVSFEIGLNKRGQPKAINVTILKQ